MKKITFLMATAFVLLSGKAQAQFAEISSDLDPQTGDIIAADINDDGLLDIVFSGRTENVVKGGVFINRGNGVYEAQSGMDFLNVGHFARFQFGDIDGDGDLDIIFNGNGGDGIPASNGIALNDGNGVFTLAPVDKYPVPETALTISCGFADLNNDGLLDYYFSGNTKPEGSPSILVYYQQADGSFNVNENLFKDAHFTDPDVTVVDFNNDGYLDLFVNGWDEVGGSRYSSTWKNDGFGEFVVYPQPNIVRKGYGSAVWGDVDGDGYLDLLLNGDGGADGESSNNIVRLYKNENGTMVAKQTFEPFRQNSVGGGNCFVDWDNDGKLDIIVGGWNETDARQATYLYKTNDPASFAFTKDETVSNEIPGISEQSYDIADLNNDGKPDLLMMGFCGTNGYNKNICGVYTNTTTVSGSKPEVLTNLNAEIEGSGEMRMVTLSWNAANGAETYNVALRNKTTGKWLYYPKAVFDGENNGFRQVSEQGNVFTNKRWELYELPDGIYEWSVQAINYNRVGGAFAKFQTFTLGTPESIESLSVAEQVKIVAVGAELRVESPAGILSHINVYNTSGVLVSSANDVDMFTTTLTKGIYIVETVDGRSTHTSKVAIY